ncbi:hypothetical protein CRE_13028 [Caenorhabditis remanei]|uniref:Uncharacterized protein n=1 Tax=Caenorhabditis remanei TaxID=31234 RepID=E3N7D4_CAERE|nr:hypothetical protein CRE_13028 [Caenorhabditis remanei]
MPTILDSPTSYSILLDSIGCLSIPVHLFGGYCIIFQTPSSMKSVKSVLFNLHFWSCWLDLIFSIIVQPFICSPTHDGVILGIIRYINMDTYAQVSVTVTLLSLVGVSTISIFENRFFLLFMQRTWWRYFRYPYLATNYILALSNFIPPLVDIPSDQGSLKFKAFERIPELKKFDSAEHPLIIIPLGFSIRALLVSFVVLFQAVGLAILINIHMRYTFKKILMSSGANNIQKMLIRAILLQISIPLFIMFIPQLVVLLTRLLINVTPSITNIINIINSIHGVSGTIMMLYLHKPYRDFESLKDRETRVKCARVVKRAENFRSSVYTFPGLREIPQIFPASVQCIVKTFPRPPAEALSNQSDEMFDELEGMEEGGGEEQQNQEIPQEEVPAEDFPIDQDIDDLLGDAPLPDDDEIIEEDEERPQTTESREKSQEIDEDNGSKEDDESPIAPSNLGNAIDALMMNWCQLLTNVTVKPPVPTPSTLDHVKEGAEVCSKHFRDASVDVNNEFTRLGIQWEMEELMDQAVVEEKNLDEAIERQFKLMENAREIIKQRTEMYAQKCPEAGKHLTT